MRATSTPRWFLTRHALKRACEMGVTRSDVVRVLDDPDRVHQTSRGCVSVRGLLVVAWEDDRVITVHWNTHERTAERNPQELVARFALQREAS